MVEMFIAALYFCLVLEIDTYVEKVMKKGHVPLVSTARKPRYNTVGRKAEEKCSMETSPPSMS